MSEMNTLMSIVKNGKIINNKRGHSLILDVLIDEFSCAHEAKSIIVACGEKGGWKAST